MLVLADPVLWREGEEQKYPNKGVLLAEVTANGNAASSGLRGGDVILSLDGQDLTKAGDLAVVKAVDDGHADAVSVRYWREGEVLSGVLRRGALDAVPDDRPLSDSLLEWSFARRRGGEGDDTLTGTTSLDRWYCGLRPLRGTRAEARAIEKTVGRAGGNTIVLRRDHANLDSLEVAAAGKQVIHLASHGFPGSLENALDPCVVLSKPAGPSTVDTAVLTLDRLISQWRAKLRGCQLVVLSMCDTQKGVTTGETTMSLPLGFFQAGVPSVIASLWEVDDEATALLMERFYENLLGQFSESRSIGRTTYSASHRMSKADALREAKLWLRTLGREDVQRLRRELRVADESTSSESNGKEARGARVATESDPDYSHPYYWAPFVLIGDGGPLD